MAATALSSTGMALHGAPDTDVAVRDVKQNAQLQAMQIDLPQDVLDQLLESMSSGKRPQLYFGRTPHLKYGDKTHLLQTNPEAYRHELYQSSGPGNEHYDEDDADADDSGWGFSALISHTLAVQKAEETTAGVDSALEQLKSSMAAMKEIKEANKTIVGEAAPMHTPGHRRFPSKGFKQQHLAPSSLGSPMLSAPSSPMAKPPTSQPAGSRDLILKALRVPLIHLLAVQPSTDAYLAETCRTSLSNVKEILPKIAKQVQDTDKYQLTEKSIKEINPWKFPYKSSEDRQKAIDAAIKLFDRSRLPKDDKLWQILLPVHERGQGKCLSRLNVKPPEPKPSTPLHKMPKLNDKKPAAPAKKAEDKDSEKDVKKKAREVKDLQEAAQVKPKKAVKAKPASQKVRESVSRPNPSSQATASANRTPPPASASAPSSTRRPAPSHRHTPSVDTMKPTDPSRIRTKKVPITKSTAAPQVTPKTATQTPTAKNISQTRDRPSRPVRPAMPVNTKPKNPSPLSASPPVNASDFEESHPVHKALSGAPSPAKTSSTNSDRSLKRKADTDNHDTKLSVKQPRLEKATPTHKGSSTGGRANGSTPASATSLKRKSDDSSTSDTPTSKVRKVANVDTGVASRYTNSNNDQHPSPGDFSSSGASPGPRLSFRQSVELSRKFKQYYKKYEELYWRLAESPTPPTEAQRNELMKMHKKLAEMKREINEAVGVKK